MDLSQYPERIEEALGAQPEDALLLAEAFVQAATLMGGAREQASSHLYRCRALMAGGEQRLGEALDAAHAATAGFALCNDALQEAEASVMAGKICLTLGEFGQAVRLLQAAISRVEQMGGPGAQALKAGALNHLAGALHSQGNWSAALTALEQARSIWINEGNLRGQAHCLSNTGNIQTGLGQYHAAIVSLTAAYALHQQGFHDVRSEAYILINLARLHSLNHQLPLAISVSHDALRVAAGLPESMIHATLHLNLGTYQLSANALRDAEHHLNEALARSRRAGYQQVELAALDSLGDLYKQLGAMHPAQEAYGAALKLALDIGDLHSEGLARLHLGQLHLSMDRLAQAETELSASLRLAQQAHTPQEEINARDALASLAAKRGDFACAFTHQQELRRIERVVQDEERQRQTRNLSVQFEVERAQHQAEVSRLQTEVEHRARREAEDLVKERTAELARAQQEVVTRLAMAAEYRDDTTGEHTRRVGRTAARIALALGWTRSRAGTLGVAARLHDVGKIGIPDTILLKPDRLTMEEYRQMQSHTQIGARILSGGRSELLQFAEQIALTHHERWDGTGYPLGLKGDEIPLAGRIVAIADVFDALTQARPYKAAWSAEEAMEEIERSSGTHFDPQLVALARPVLRAINPAQDERRQQGIQGFLPETLPFTSEDTSHVLTIFEHLLVEHARELEAARREAVELSERMTRIALTDSLTGLANRRAFELDLDLACTPAACVAGSGSGGTDGLLVLSLDLDGLKALNDAHGHSRGDSLLMTFSRALAEAFSTNGMAYRLGGDEFAVIVPSSIEQTVLHGTLLGIAEQLTQEFSGSGVSYGIAVFPEEATSAGDLLRLSDQRMYANKNDRRRRTRDVVDASSPYL